MPFYTTLMMKWSILPFVVLVLVVSDRLPAADDTTKTPTEVQLEHFEKVIRPLLARRCFSCHSKSAKKLNKADIISPPNGLAGSFSSNNGSSP